VSQRKPDTKEEFAMLAGGVGRTFLGDFRTVVLAALIGCAIGAGLVAVYFGLNWTFIASGAKIGALTGGFFGLLFRSFLNPLFDYKPREPK